MKSIQKDHLKKFSLFIWKHVLKLVGFILILSVLIAGRIPRLEGTLIFFTFAILIDWLKVQKGSNNSSNYRMDDLKKLQEFNNLDPTQYGSAAWNMNPYTYGSCAYYSSTYKHN